jgi:hypothetical protein
MLPMNKMLARGAGLLALGLLLLTAGGWVFVPDIGETGWRTFSYTAGSQGFSGTAGFVVSNVIDDSAYSELLVDNLSHGGLGSNRGFEARNYSGYNLLGDSAGEVSPWVLAESGNVYTPTQGDFLSHQFSLAPGVSTAAFLNAHGQAGTSGSVLETDISLIPGEIFSFDWAFLARDFSPWNDFSLFYLKDDQGIMVFSQGLGQIGCVPAPSTVLLLGTGILGLMGLGWRTRKR